MMKNEMTYVVALDAAIAAVTDEAVKEKLTVLRGTIARRKSAPSKKKLAEMDARITAVYEALLECDEPVTAGELLKHATNDVAGFSIQRVSALLTKLANDGKAVKTVEKRKAFYAVAE